MRAPKAGEVVYAHKRHENRMIEVGSKVHYCQNIFRITNREKLVIADTDISVMIGFIKRLNLDEEYLSSHDKEMLALGYESKYIENGDDMNLKNKVSFIGKICDDDLGQKYEAGLKKENVDFIYSKKKESLPTGTCLILVTPDSERTMCTFLGTAGKINENDVDAKIIKQSEMIFLEGYLWDEGEPKKAFTKAINHANKVAMSLSDLFCVERHKANFLDLVKNARVTINYCRAILKENISFSSEPLPSW